MTDNREMAKKSWAAHYWDCTLTHKGREKALLTVGHAAAYQFPAWHDLPADLKHSLRRLWGEQPRWTTIK